jgi:hypothetical protein
MLVFGAIGLYLGLEVPYVLVQQHSWQLYTDGSLGGRLTVVTAASASAGV